jgi:hypothetical protein
MSPHKAAGVVQFLKSHGPIPECCNEDGIAALLPHEVELQGADGLIAAFSKQCDAQEASGPLDFPDAQKWSDAIAKVAGQRLPAEKDDPASLWVLENYPEMASAFTQMKCSRELQLSIAKSLQTWMSEDMSKGGFLAAGFGKQVAALDQSLSNATRLSAIANATMVQLHRVQGAHLDVAAQIIPLCTNFGDMLSDAQSLRGALGKAVGAKAKRYLRDPMANAQSKFDKNFRAWSGVQSKTSRCLTTLKVELTTKDIQEVAPAYTALEKPIGEVDACASVFAGVKSIVAEATFIVTSARFYVAVMNSLINIVVKPAQPYPFELLKQDLKKHMCSLGAQGYWAGEPPASAGEEALVDTTEGTSKGTTWISKERYWSDHLVCEVNVINSFMFPAPLSCPRQASQDKSSGVSSRPAVLGQIQGA